MNIGSREPEMGKARTKALRVRHELRADSPFTTPDSRLRGKQRSKT